MYKQVGLHVRFLFYCEVHYSSVPFQGHPKEVLVPQSMCSAGVYCVSVGSKKLFGSCKEKYFCFAGELFSVCSRSCSVGYFYSMCPSLISPPPPPPAELLKGEFAEAYSHVHFDERCIRILLLCLLVGKLPPSPAGKR